jgi:hypothetical protein
MESDRPLQGKKQQGAIIDVGKNIHDTVQQTGKQKPEKPARPRTDIATRSPD